MQARVRLFASYREQAGGDRFDVALPDPAVVSDAVAALLAAAPALPRAFTPHLIAVNRGSSPTSTTRCTTATRWRSTRPSPAAWTPASYRSA